MDSISKMSNEALSRYFNTLSTLGYKGDQSVFKLLVILFIEELLTGEFSQFVTEDDYRDITKAIYCIIGNSCLVDFPSYTTWDSLFHFDYNQLYHKRYRITEDSVLRKTEDSLFRAEE